MLWSDLAKPNNSVVNFFLSLFQLILHLASLSRLAIDSGAQEGTGWVWVAFRTVQRYAVRLLQIFIPLLELILLISLTACLIEVWSVTRGQAWVTVAFATVGAVAIGVIVIVTAKRRVIESLWVWVLRALAPPALGLTLSILPWLLWTKHQSDELVKGNVADIAGTLLFWLIAGLGLWWILTKYEEERKGVRVTGIGLFFISLMVFIIFIERAYTYDSANLPATVRVATLATGQVLLGAVRLCWGAMTVLASVALILGSIGWRIMKYQDENGPEWGRARAAVRTSRLALALPATLFLTVTLLIWAGFLEVTHQLMPENGLIFTEDVVKQLNPPNWAISASLLQPLELNCLDLR